MCLFGVIDKVKNIFLDLFGAENRGLPVETLTVTSLFCFIYRYTYRTEGLNHPLRYLINNTKTYYSSQLLMDINVSLYYRHIILEILINLRKK